MMSSGAWLSLCLCLAFTWIATVDGAFTLSIRENAALKSTFKVTLATGETIAFKTAPKEFGLNTDGTVTVNAKLDYETTKSYSFDVTITKGGTTRDDKLQVMIQDVNDEKPVIVRKFKKTRVYPNGLPENATAVLYKGVDTGDGAVIYCVHATDVDTTANLTYQFAPDSTLSADLSNNFRIVPQLGCIVRKGFTKLKAAITKYEFPVMVTDQNTEVFENKHAYVLVTAYVNFREPQIAAIPYTLEFLESTPANSKIGFIHALPLNNKFASLEWTWTPMQPFTDSFPFSLNKNTGEVTLLQKFTYQRTCKQEWHAEVSVTEKTGGKSYTAKTQVFLVLRDSNNFRPFFQQDVYFTKSLVREDISTSSVVLTVPATDPDESSKTDLKYSLSGTGSDIFQITTNPVTAAGEIKRVKLLEYEKLGADHAVTMTVAVTDGIGASATATAVIYVQNVNTKAPTFSGPSAVTVGVQRENFGTTVIFQALAYDADGSTVEYFFLRADGTKVSSTTNFNIDKDNGVIVYKARPSKDSTTTTSLTIVAVDKRDCSPSPCINSASALESTNMTLMVNFLDMNTEAPKFNPKCPATISIKEDLKVGANVLKLKAEDRDVGLDGKEMYELISNSYTPNPYKYVNISSTGQITLTRTFDRESEDEKYTGLWNVWITVVARDSGSNQLRSYCTMRVKVIDVNDNAPKFDESEYATGILKSQAYSAGQKVIQVFAYDPDEYNTENNRVIYGKGENFPADFEIDTSTGWITFRTAKAANSINVAIYRFNVTARNPTAVVAPGSNVPVKALVRVFVETDQKRLPPVASLSKTVVSMKENEAADFVVDSGTATLPGGTPSQFNILDRSGDTKETNVGQMFFKIRRTNATNGQFSIIKIGNIDATSMSHVYYKMRIKRTGVKYTDGTVSVDVYLDLRLTVNIVDVNDKIPTFIVFSYKKNTDIHIPENTKFTKVNNKPVVTLYAADKDVIEVNRKIKYSVDTNPYFVISNTDEVYVKEGAPAFDYENKNTREFDIKVNAEDGADSALSGVTGKNKAHILLRVLVTDVNDNAPSFENATYSFNVREDQALSKPFGKVVGKDPDVSDRNALTYSINDKNVPFGIDALTGDLYPTKHLDYEVSAGTARSYSFVVKVFDGKFSGSATVSITVTDVNDNPPVFSSATAGVIKVSMTTGTMPPSPWHTVTVTDKDTSATSSVSAAGYWITGSFNYYGYKSSDKSLYAKTANINPNNNILRANNVYHFTLKAFDGLLYGYAEVQVTVKTSGNLYAPCFVMASLHGWMTTDTTTAMTLAAKDRDSTSTLTYGKEGTTKFNVNPSTGVVTVNSPITTPSTTFDSFVATVSDGASKVTAKATVTVIGVSTKAVACKTTPYLVDVFDNTKLNEVFHIITVNDVEPADRRKLKYTVTDTFFNIRDIKELDAGGLYLKAAFTEAGPRTIIVSVKDRKFSTINCQVKISKKDGNDHAPVVTFTPTMKSLQEATGPVKVLATPQSLTTIQVSDLDTGDTKFTLSLSNTFPDISFNPGIMLRTINDRQGELLLVKSLDREKLTTGTGPAVVRVIVMANDQRWPYKTGTQTFTLTVTDAVDVPSLNLPSPAFIDTSKGAGATVTPNPIPIKPPGTYTFKPDTSSPVWSSNPAFTIANSGGSFSLQSRRSLAAETGSSILVPVIVESSTGTPLTTVTVTVGLQTGKLQDTNRKVSAMVSYGWAWYWAPNVSPVSLGSLYGRKLYGSDAVGVTYSMTNPYTNYFKLNTTTGQIAIVGSVPQGVYNLTGTVQRGSQSAKAVVIIDVKTIGTEALNNVATLLLSNTNIATLLKRVATTSGSTAASYQPSQLEQIRSVIAASVKTTVAKVLIVSLQEDAARKTVTVFYVASGSPYYSPVKLNYLLLTNKTALEAIPGVKVVGTTIDKCSEEPEKCVHGCVNRVKVDQASAGVNNFPTSGFIGVRIHVEAVCECDMKTSVVPASVCGMYSCLNKGNCSMDPGTTTTKCACPDSYDGPRCQKLDVTFGTADGYLFTEPLGSCGRFDISFEFVTAQSGTVLLLYAGPYVEGAAGDKLVVELVDGSAKVTTTFGTATQSLQITSPTPKLNDGKWHRIDIWYRDGNLHLMTDRCRNAPVLAQDGINVLNRASCQKELRVKATGLLLLAYRLKVGLYPMQVGGSNLRAYPTGVIGSVRNLRVNGDIRNLVPEKLGTSKNANTNARMRAGCYDANSKTLCGAQSMCRSALDGNTRLCKCKPGYRKDSAGKCTTATKIYDYRIGSYTAWNLKSVPTESTKMFTHVSMRFRTRQTFGTLLYVPGNDFIRNQSLWIRIHNSRAEVVTNLGDFKFKRIVVPNTNVSDGAWHTIEMSRIVDNFELLLDGGDLGNYVFDKGVASAKYNYITLNQMFLSGARMDWQNPSAFTFNYLFSDFNNSCVTDVRFDDSWVPLDAADSANTAAVAQVHRNANRKVGCANDNVCPKPDTCASPLVCLAVIWRPLTSPSCSCNIGYALFGTRCLAVGICSPNPCYMGTCVVDRTKTGGYLCQCPKFYTGKHCEIYAGAATAGLGAGIIVLIIIFILLILLALLLFVWFTKCRRREDKLLDYPDEDIRENIVHYGEEGAGEEDHEGYDLTQLRKPINDIQPAYVRPLKSGPPRDTTDLGNFLDGRLQDAENDPHGPPQDYSLDYGYEGQGSVVDDLSSLGSGTSDGSQRYDHLNSLGPKFRPLSDLYNRSV